MEEFFTVIDANVLAYANNTEDNFDCSLKASEFLNNFISSGNILSLDNMSSILDEYYKVVSIGKPTNARAFFLWFNKYSSGRVQYFNIPGAHENDDAILPTDYSGFDRNDRKYLYVARNIREILGDVEIVYCIDRGYGRFSNSFIRDTIGLKGLCIVKPDL